MITEVASKCIEKDVNVLENMTFRPEEQNL